MRNIFLILFLLLTFSHKVAAVQVETVSQQTIDNADFYLLDAMDGSSLVARALETYKVGDEIFVPVTPLFEAFRLRYRLKKDSLTVFKNDEELDVEFNASLAAGSETRLWFKDDYYTYISTSLISELLDIDIKLDTKLLRLTFNTGNYVLPYKIIAEQNKRRSGFFKPSDINSGATPISQKFDFITIDDTYRLFTQPTGYIDYSYADSSTGNEYNLSTVLVSDLLYHSSTLIYNDNDNAKTGRLTLSKYRSSDNKAVLGFWDSYSFGDIYTVRKDIDTSPSRGFGVNFVKNAERLSRDNMETSFYEEAPPGWEAEVFHNNVFLETRTVPTDGVLQFENIELYYGVNQFKILLFGPFGEEDVIYRQIDLRTPRLATGDSTLKLSLSDQDFDWTNGEVNEFNPDVSMSYSRGLTKWWVSGASINLADSEQDFNIQSIILDNTFNLPNILLENDLSIFENGEVSQQTTVATSVTGADSLFVRYFSRGNSSNSNLVEQQRGSMSYANYFGNVSVSLGYNFSELNNVRDESYFNRIASNIGSTYISNTFRFDPNSSKEVSLIGNFNVNSRITSSIRASLDLPYRPYSEDNFDYDSAQLSLQYQYRDKRDISHSAKLSMSSIFEDNRWQLTYNTAWKSPLYQFYFRSSYNYNDNYSIQAGIKFFFGYDNNNNRPIFSSDLSPHSGSLDVHTYLDRYINGVPDVLDYNIAGVTVSANKSSVVQTESTGKARLFGLNPGANYISSTWDNGAKTYTNKYVVFSHPGSNNSANMPFYLNSEFESFVLLNVGDEIIPQRNVPVKVTNKVTTAKLDLESDIDGYVYFDKLTPGSYRIELDRQFLADRGFTADIIGYDFDTSLRGGFIVIPDFIVKQSDSPLAERIETLKLDDSNSQALVNDDKLMHLPQKNEINAPFTLDKEIKVSYSGEGKLNETINDLSDLASLSGLTHTSRLGVTSLKPVKSIDTTAKKEFALYVGEFDTLSLAMSAANAQGVKSLQFISGLSFLNRKVYRFNVATFTTNEEAEMYAKVNYPQQSFNIIDVDKNISFDSGWVIQFAAKQGELDFDTQLELLTSLERLYISRKLVKGVYWNCLISHVFESKSEAEDFLSKLSINGFIVPANNFENTIWSKYQ